MFDAMLPQAARPHLRIRCHFSGSNPLLYVVEIASSLRFPLLQRAAMTGRGMVR
jgi:hypothetical protein